MSHRTSSEERVAPFAALCAATAAKGQGWAQADTLTHSATLLPLLSIIFVSLVSCFSVFQFSTTLACMFNKLFNTLLFSRPSFYLAKNCRPLFYMAGSRPLFCLKKLFLPSDGELSPGPIHFFFLDPPLNPPPRV